MLKVRSGPGGTVGAMIQLPNPQTTGTARKYFQKIERGGVRTKSGRNKKSTVFLVASKMLSMNPKP